MPQLFQCAGCGRELTEEETGELFFSQGEHGILCADCSRMAMDRKRISAAALYAMRYIAVSPLAKLYTFTVRDDVLRELERHIYRYTELNTDKRFKSLEILELMREITAGCGITVTIYFSKAGQDAMQMEISLKNHEDTSIIRPKMKQLFPELSGRIWRNSCKSRGEKSWKRQWTRLWHWRKASGFVYPGSEIYGGLANTWDYGNLGVELKNNVKTSMVAEIHSWRIRTMWVWTVRSL